MNAAAQDSVLGARLELVEAPADQDPRQALQEVRTELRDALDALQLAGRQIRALNGVLQDITASLAPVLAAHLSGDAKGTKAALQRFVNERCRVVDGRPSGRLQ